MSSRRRINAAATAARATTRAAALAALLALAACGFKPLYAPDGGGALYGVVALQEATDPESFAYRERLRRRLGDDGGGGSGGATRTLSWAIDMVETGVAVTPTSDTTRYRVRATARYRLSAVSDDAAAIEGEVRTEGAFDATAAPFATRAARRDEREKLAIELAELTATRLLAATSAAE